MLAYWNQLKPNERTMLSVGGIIVTILMLYLLLLEPFMLKADELTVKIASQKAQVEYLKEASIEVKQLQALRTGSSANIKDQSLLVVVDQTAKKNNLGNFLKRIEPNGSDRVRVWLDNAPFDDVAKWLSFLHSKYQLGVESAVFDKVDAKGRVNVRLVFLEGGA